MTDIVERLRLTADWLDQPPPRSDPPQFSLVAVEHEAADEIERLRKRERRLAARVKQLHDIIQADRGPDFYIPAADEPTA